MEPLQTQDRRETGRLRSGAHPEIGREPQSLHGVARILLVARPLPRRHDLRRKRAIITYRTEQGPPSRYGKINYEFNDKFIEKIILQDTASTLIRPGGIFNSATLDAERERITRYLRDRGYYNFSVNNISYRYPYDTVGSRVGD